MGEMFHTGKLLSQESYNEMITPSEDSGYGFGLIISDGIIRHSGVIDGFNSYTDMISKGYYNNNFRKLSIHQHQFFKLSMMVPSYVDNKIEIR